MKSPKYKFIYKATAFSFIFIVINVLYLALLVYTDWNFKKRIESLSFKNPGYELLVLGNSLAMDGFDTELLTSYGLKSYNLAIGGSSIKTNYVQLNEYLTKNEKKPKYVILGLGSYMSSSEDGTVHPIVEFTMGGHRFTRNDLPIVKFQWLGVEFAKKIISSNHRNARLSYGQLKFQKKVPDSTKYTNRALNIKYYQNSYYIAEIAKICIENGIEFIIIEMPGYFNTQNQSEIGPTELSLENGCMVNLYNFNSKDFCEMFNSDEDWIGNSHLNEYGAVKFTKEVFKTISHKKTNFQ